MRLHRFYLEQSIANSVVKEKTQQEIKVENEDLIHQWRDVFRYTTGAQVVVFDGDGFDYLCMIAHIYNRTAELAIVSKKKSVMPADHTQHKLALALSMIKKDNMELVIQKATELGVSEIFPILSERSEKKSLNMTRAKKIAIEASEQSGRGDVPSIHEPIDLDEFLKFEKNKENLNGFESKIVCDPSGEKKLDKSVIKSSALICIGPEGGYSEKELALFKAQGFEICNLGNLVLRAETAAIAVLAMVN
jgi:16S rRNA (uracil1498-N3)-methyltransferase